VAGNPSNNFVDHAVGNQCSMGVSVLPGASCKIFVSYNTKDLTTTPDFDGDFVVNSAELVFRNQLNEEVVIIFEMTNFDPILTPHPAALPLFASGLVGLLLLGWRRRRKPQAITTALVLLTSTALALLAAGSASPARAGTVEMSITDITAGATSGVIVGTPTAFGSTWTSMGPWEPGTPPAHWVLASILEVRWRSTSFHSSVPSTPPIRYTLC
jgi:hypothetical protein